MPSWGKNYPGGQMNHEALKKEFSELASRLKGEFEASETVLDKHRMPPIHTPPSAPELNGVANALALLEFANDVPGAIKQLRMYVDFRLEFAQKPLFWHEWKERNGL